MMEAWLNFFTHLGQGEFLPELLGIIFFIFLASLMIGVFFKGLLFLLRYSLEWMRTLIKILGLLAILLLFYTLIQVMLDSNRPCGSAFESALTRCSQFPQKEQSGFEKFYRERNRRRLLRAPRN